MAHERLDDAKRTTPSVEVEKDAQSKRDRPTGNIKDKDTEDVKADEAIDDRFQATDN